MSDPTNSDSSSGSNSSEPNAFESAEHGQSYQVIARRYRPRFFHEVVGQEAIAQTLQQAFLQERIAHAYLFCGPRGVGKTSMARIFARSLQCPDSVEGQACNKCQVCERIFCGEDLDVTELDGASHRGIDDVRELLQSVRYAPTNGSYRIYIIDEVHMLTREAFNALLKTLEEPPPHVKFVFATTEPEKIPPTVISRCQRCDFSPIGNEDIARRLEQICELEGVKAQNEIMLKIAELARGGMRDSQSLLDQLLSFSAGQPTMEHLYQITGRLSDEAIGQMLSWVDQGDRAQLLIEYNKIISHGADPSVLLEQILEFMRGQLHAGLGDGWGRDEIDRSLLSQEILQEARLRIRRLGDADVILELALLRLATLADLVPISQWQSLLQSGVVQGGPVRPGLGSPNARQQSFGQENNGQQVGGQAHIPSPQNFTRPAQFASSQSAAPPAARQSGSPQDASQLAPRQSSSAPSAPAQPSSLPEQGKSGGRGFSSRPQPGGFSDRQMPMQKAPEQSYDNGGTQGRGAGQAADMSATATAVQAPQQVAVEKKQIQNPRAAIKELMQECAPMMHMVVDDDFQLNLENSSLTIELDQTAAQRLPKDSSSLFQKKLSSLFDREMSLIFETTKKAEEDSIQDSATLGVVDTTKEGDTPAIVSKAQEIFKAELRRER